MEYNYRYLHHYSDCMAITDKPSLVKNVREAVLRSGFPLEIAVIGICSKKNVGRIPNFRYTYKEKSREIDLITQFETFVNEPKKEDSAIH